MRFKGMGLIVGFIAIGCGGGGAQPTAEPRASSTTSAPATSQTVAVTPATRPTVKRAPPGEPPRGTGKCALEGEGRDIRRLDVNGDGKPDVIEVRVAGKLECKILDLTSDGMPDEWRHFDEAEEVFRIERDLDGDGRVDQISEKAHGACVGVCRRKR